MFLSSVAVAGPVKKDVVITIHDVLVPERVEKGTDAKIVISGMFPNTCYSWSHPEVVTPNPMNHLIRAHAIVTQTMCLMVLVPFSKEVNLGKLAPGSHTLRFVNGDDTYFERTLDAE